MTMHNTRAPVASPLAAPRQVPEATSTTRALVAPTSSAYVSRPSAISNSPSRSSPVPTNTQNNRRPQLLPTNAAEQLPRRRGPRGGRAVRIAKEESTSEEQERSFTYKDAKGGGMTNEEAYETASLDRIMTGTLDLELRKKKGRDVQLTQVSQAPTPSQSRLLTPIQFRPVNSQH